jgi:uncharacterized membrane protein
MWPFFKTTIIGGLLFLVPFAVLVIIFERIAPPVGKVVHPIAAFVPFSAYFGPVIPFLLTIAAIVLICFFVGLLAGTGFARRLVELLEANILERIPLYTIVQSMSRDFAGNESSARNVVLVRFDDAWQFGLRMSEAAQDGLVAVFIPDSPTPQTGSVFLVESDRIKPTEMTTLALFKALKGRGIGMARIPGPNRDPV